MWPIHTIEYSNENKLLLHRTTWVNLTKKKKKLNEKSQTQRVHILWFHLYKVHKQSKLTNERSQDSGHCCGTLCCWKDTWTHERMLEMLFLDGGSSYMEVFTLCKFTEPYTYDLCTFLYIRFTLKFWTTISS